MQITNELMSIFISYVMVYIIICMFIYTFVYSKKGKGRNLNGYMNALKNGFGLSIISIFIIAGIFLIKICISEAMYVGLIIPIAWYVMSYHLIKNILNNDFGLNMHILKSTSKFNQALENIKFASLPLILTIGCGYTTFIAFKEVALDIKSGGENVVLLSIVGTVFLCVTIFISILTYYSVKGIMIKELMRNKKIEKVAVSSLLGMFILTGILVVMLGGNLTYEYEEKAKIYEKTQGMFVDRKIYSERNYENNTTYSLGYSYEVEGKEYIVYTDYGTEIIPLKGSKKTILYNPESPSEAIIEGNFSGNFLKGLGAFFIIVPMIIIIFKSKNK